MKTSRDSNQCDQISLWLAVQYDQNFTTIRLSVTDINDNVPTFGTEMYRKSILVKDAKEGVLVLKLLATDKDAGNNSVITYRLVGFFHPDDAYSLGAPPQIQVAGRN